MAFQWYTYLTVNLSESKVGLGAENLRLVSLVQKS